MPQAFIKPHSLSHYVSSRNLRNCQHHIFSKLTKFNRLQWFFSQKNVHSVRDVFVNWTRLYRLIYDRWCDCLPQKFNYLQLKAMKDELGETTKYLIKNEDNNQTITKKSNKSMLLMRFTVIKCLKNAFQFINNGLNKTSKFCGRTTLLIRRMAKKHINWKLFCLRAKK